MLKKMIDAKLNRRQMLGTGAVAGVAVATRASDAIANVCKAVAVEFDEFQTTQTAGATVYYFVDGIHFDERSDLQSRANMAFSIDLQQMTDSFVDCVMLLDKSNNILAAEYFRQSDSQSGNQVPYVVMENLDLKNGDNYKVVYRLVNDGQKILYMADVSPQRSALNQTWLPTELRNDLKNFLVGNTANPTPGLISSPYQFFTLNGTLAHTARARVKALNRSSGDFTINFDFMHGDASAEHFMRYFIVMDPVGRILGIKKRSLGDGESGSLDISKISASEMTDWGLTADMVGDIRDCPYIQCFTDCDYDGLFRMVLHLA